MYKNNKGITLIALVITIIVMLILVGVTISMAVKGGLFDYAGRAVSETNSALKQEQQLINDIIDEYIKPNLPSTVETISKTESYIGCYADTDGDGEADGVIYADLAFSKTGYYEAEATEDLKDYYISGTHDGDFNEEDNLKEVITAVENNEGIDRFYVMALEDFTTTDYSAFTWYASKAEEVLTISTSSAFGTGKTNTEAWISLWNSDDDVLKSEQDVWNFISMENNWFIPSQYEWYAFFRFLGDAGLLIFDVSDEYLKVGLSSGRYFTSSLAKTGDKYYIMTDSYSNHSEGSVEGSSYDSLERLRLSTTF